MQIPSAPPKPPMVRLLDRFTSVIIRKTGPGNYMATGVPVWASTYSVAFGPTPEIATEALLRTAWQAVTRHELEAMTLSEVQDVYWRAGKVHPVSHYELKVFTKDQFIEKILEFQKS